MAKRRNRVRGIDVVRVWIVAAAAGVAMAIFNLKPTGDRRIDFLVTGVAVGAAVWATASTPALALLLGAITAVVLAVVFPSPLGLIFALGAAVLAGAIRAGHRNWPWARAITGALICASLANLGERFFFGAPTLAGLGVVATLGVLGIRRRPRQVRRNVIRLGILTSLVVVGGAVAGGVAAWRARSAISEAVSAARVAQRLVGTGDMVRATEQLRIAASSLQQANSFVNTPLAQAARLVPVVSQHRRLLAELSATTSREMTVAADSLAQFDPSTLGIVNGRIDIAAIRGLEQPVLNLQGALERVELTRVAVDSPWLIAPVSQVLQDFGTDTTDFRNQTDELLQGVRVMPNMLGAEGPRRYFVAINTPAEARGLGGFMGSFAEVTVNAGRFQVERVDSTGVLNGGGSNPLERRITGPQYFLDNYGQYGFTSTDTGTTEVEAWSNITMAPDFPTVAQVITELYPQSGGQPIDGVFAIDVLGLSGLLQMTGPINVPGITLEDLDADGIVEFLLERQYLIDEFYGRDSDYLLRQIAEATFDAIINGVLPGPVDIGRIMGRYVDEGRVLGFSTRSEEQAFLTTAGLTGALPQAGGADGFAVALNNVAPNKIDTFTERSISYEGVVNPATGSVATTLTVTLINTAPRTGLPNVVLQNQFGEERGSARTMAMIYTQMPVARVLIEGEPVPFETIEELGWRKTTVTVVVPPGGGKRVITLSLSGAVAPGGYELVARPHPLVSAEQVSIKVSEPNGRILIGLNAPMRKVTRWNARDFEGARDVTSVTTPE